MFHRCPFLQQLHLQVLCCLSGQEIHRAEGTWATGQLRTFGKFSLMKRYCEKAGVNSADF